MAKNSPWLKPPESQPTRTRSFLKNFQEQVEKILETKDSEDTRPILILAADEGRFGRLGEVRACWCPEEIRSIIAKQVREYIYAYAAVAPQLGQMTWVHLTLANISSGKLTIEISTAKRKNRGNALNIPLCSR
jgi:hypothetical protein